jgi:hypothetical protein
MVLTFRPTSPIPADEPDYIVYDEGWPIGRLCKDGETRPEAGWFWSITVYVEPKLEFKTHGRAPSLEAAKEAFQVVWLRCRSFGVQP